MNLLHNGLGLWVSDCDGLSYDAIVMKDHVFEIMSNEFATSDKGDLGRARILQEPFLFCNIGYGDGSFVSILVFLNQLEAGSIIVTHLQIRSG